MLLYLYRLFTSSLINPFLRFHLRLRLKQGKEHPQRYLEKCGIYSVKRPDGSLIWFHAASVGESLSILSLIERIQSLDHNFQFLITTGTLNSAKLISQQLPRNSIHQFAPLDARKWVIRFLDYWKPSLALMIESELWPNLILETHARHIPLILLNARISDRSYNLWCKFKSPIRSILKCFNLFVCPSQEQALRLTSLGASTMIVSGNLKFASKPLGYQEGAFKALKNSIKNRPLWVAASTHPSEEELIAQTHTLISKVYPTLLTIIVPRHPERKNELLEMLSKNFKVTARSSGQLPSSNTQLYLGDTLGEMGLFYRLSDIIFMGGSLVPIGGHNLIEPALLNSAILHGPYTFKSRELVNLFKSHQASIEIKNPRELSEKIIELLNNTTLRKNLAEAAYTVASTQRETLAKIVNILEPYLLSKKIGFS